MRYLLADPALTHRSPGEEFARCVVSQDGSEITVPLAVSLPATFPLAAHRPRYTVRHLLKTATVTTEPARYVSETPVDAPAVAGTSYLSTPEAAFAVGWAETELTELSTRVRIPPGLARDPALLAAFIDHRVVVRLCTVENEALLQGTSDKTITGLLRLPGLRRRAASGPLDAELVRAAAEVEETGGSCDGIVTHPIRYWELVRSGLLERLGHAGVRVSRTRMIGPDQALLGDFRAAVTLLETGTSTIALTRGGDLPDMVTASIRIGLAVHLPQHFLLLDLT